MNERVLPLVSEFAMSRCGRMPESTIDEQIPVSDGVLTLA
jgi:hypothetical protein